MVLSNQELRYETNNKDCFDQETQQGLWQPKQGILPVRKLFFKVHSGSSQYKILN